jgi:hypothetical protein
MLSANPSQCEEEKNILPLPGIEHLSSSLLHSRYTD